MASTDAPRSTPPRRLGSRVLRPGLHVLRRSAKELQVGLGPERAVILPDTDEVRVLLDSLATPGSPSAGAPDAPARDLLEEAGMLVDDDLLLPLAPARTGEAVPSRGDLSALAARAGDTTPARLAARRSVTVGVVAVGAPSARHWAGQVTDLLTGSGVACASADAATGAAAVMLVAVGEPAREELDPWVRAGTPHLLLRLVEGSAVVGPFVVPGQTACLRCVDAHHTDLDPAWPLLVAQYAAACTRTRADALPEPVDPLLATLASAWAARELVTWLEGESPTTAGGTVRLDPRLRTLESYSWPRHPACGCDWG